MIHKLIIVNFISNHSNSTLIFAAQTFQRDRLVSGISIRLPLLGNETSFLHYVQLGGPPFRQLKPLLAWRLVFGGLGRPTSPSPLVPFTSTPTPPGSSKMWQPPGKSKVFGGFAELGRLGSFCGLIPSYGKISGFISGSFQPNGELYFNPVRERTSEISELARINNFLKKGIGKTFGADRSCMLKVKQVSKN